MRNLITIITLMYSISAVGEEVSLSTLIATFGDRGFKAVYDLAAKHTELLNGRTIVRISDQAYLMGSDDEVVKTTWFYKSNLDNSFEVRLPIAQRYLKDRELLSTHAFVECDGSGASARALYISFNSSEHVFYSSSGGTAGISYSVKFKNEKYGSVKEKCKAVWRS
jgi:hypothetical protein